MGLRLQQAKRMSAARSITMVQAPPRPPLTYQSAPNPAPYSLQMGGDQRTVRRSARTSGGPVVDPRLYAEFAGSRSSEIRALQSGSLTADEYDILAALASQQASVCVGGCC